MEPDQDQEGRKSSDMPTVYGELSILGYNGYIPNRNGRQNKSKFLLCKRPQPNGIKKDRHYIVKHPQTSKPTEDNGAYFISYTFSRSQTIVVEYSQNSDTDLFQIGRSSEEPIDFVVLDTMVATGEERQKSSSRQPHNQSNDNSNITNTNNNTNQSDHNENYVQYLSQHQSHQDFYQPQMYNPPPHRHGHYNNNNNINNNNNTDNNNSNNNNNNHHHQHHHHQHHNHRPQKLEGSHNIESNGNSHASQSTISRFACRILVDREPPHTARIYAAGFDSSKSIFLGEKATKWEQDDSFDGLTTNGVLLNLDGIWREVSVEGGIYAIRESRSAAQKGTRIEGETNILRDGALIDLCGATLLWRSLEGFKRAPTKRTLEEKIDLLNASRPQCPVGLNTLIIPRKPILTFQQHYHRSGGSKNGQSKDVHSGQDYHPQYQLLQQQHNHHSHHHHHHHHHNHHSHNHNHQQIKPNSQQPYVYLKCGHVQGYHDWGATDKSNQRTCPICLSVGTVAKLSMGLEPSFYVDSGPLTQVFNPCGHMASEDTVKYWCSVKIPYGTHFFHSICPFCATPLATDEPPSTRLIFQDDLD